MASIPPPHTSLFHGQKSILITGGYFQQNVNCPSEQGLPILLQAASLSAGHDASDRDPPPRCAEGTREKVITDVMDWITDFNPSEGIMWLNGPFGNGKSAVMQTIADRLRDDPSLNHLLAASFFFGRGKSGRDKAKYLIPTIAYQIAISIPSMREAINNALIQDPTILSKSIDAQLRYLITTPLRAVASAPFHTPTVFIDGLDECEGHDFQRLILKAIYTAVLKEDIALRFLIASRPEPQISETFRTQPLNQHHCAITLVDDYQTREELRQFLQSGFDEMYQRRLDLLSTVEQPWPSKDDLSTLVYRASGQFLYASTVLRFVDSDMAHPKHQLALILQRQSGNAFSNMDELYGQILESYPCQKDLPGFLRSLLTEKALKSEYQTERVTFYKPTLANHSAISGLHPGDVSVILRWFPAIIEVKRSPDHSLPDDWPLQKFMQLYSPTLSIHHQSFIEFITDHRRSGKFHVNLDTAYQEMKTHLDALFAESLSKGEHSPRIHESVWKVVHYLLYQDLRAHRLGPSLGWPHLLKTLNDFKEGRTPPLSKPCPEFLDALRHVLYTLNTCLDRKLEHKIIRTFTDLYDQSFLLTISPNSELWTIAGVLALKVEPHGLIAPRFEPGFIGYSHCIAKLPQLTGLPLATIFRILEENWNFFDLYESGHLCCSFYISLRHHEAFLEDEVRSRDLYVTYRGSAVSALKSRINNLNSARKLGMLFASFFEHGWDIRIDEDLRKPSHMDEVLDLLLHNDPITPNLIGHEDRRRSDYYSNRCAREAFYESMKWLFKQFHNLNVVPNPNRATTMMIQHLQDIIDRSKDDAIIFCFDFGRLRFLSRGKNLRPYNSVIDVESLDKGRWDSFSSSIQKFYSNSSLLLNGISADCHASILRYHLHALISWIYFLIEGWSSPAKGDDDDDDDEVRGLDDQFESKLDGVQWEYHLSRASVCETIHSQLSTIRFLCAFKECDYGVECRALELLPTTLLRGGLVWFRKHCTQDGALHFPAGPTYEYYARGAFFEQWCEEMITMRGEVCPSARLSKPLVRDIPQSASISPFHHLAASTLADVSSASIGSTVQHNSTLVGTTEADTTPRDASSQRSWYSFILPFTS